MVKTDYQKAKEIDTKGLPVHDWHPSRITKKYKDGWERTFGKKVIRADKKLDK